MSSPKKTKTKNNVKDHSGRRLQQLADENRNLRQYVADLMDRLQENERLFSRLFELETEVLAAPDVETMCFVLLRGLHNRFKLDMVRLWFDRSSFIGGRTMDAISERDLVWIESGEIEQMGLAERQVLLLRLGPEKGFSWLAAGDEHLASLALLTLGNLTKPFGVMGMASVDPDRFQPEQATDFLQHLAQIVSLSLENSIVRDRVARLSITDALTGGFNRRFLQPNSRQPVSQWFGQNVDVACLYLDVDDYKSVADRIGEDAGSKILKGVSEAIGRNKRGQDPLVRMRDAEFALLLAGCSRTKAEEIGWKIVNACGALEFEGQEISLSMGLASAEAGREMRVKDLVASSEHAMYVARALGGNRLEIAEEPEE